MMGTTVMRFTRGIAHENATGNHMALVAEYICMITSSGGLRTAS